MTLSALCELDDCRRHFAMHRLVEDVVRTGKFLELQRVYLLSVSAHCADRRDRIVDAVYRQRRHRELR